MSEPEDGAESTPASESPPQEPPAAEAPPQESPPAQEVAAQESPPQEAAAQESSPQEPPAQEAAGQDDPGAATVEAGEDDELCGCGCGENLEGDEDEGDEGGLISSVDDGGAGGDWAGQMFSCPIDTTAGITSDIGFRAFTDQNGVRRRQCHKALDIGTHRRVGLVVRSIFDGVIRNVWRSFGGYGLAIYVDHGERGGMGLRSFYAHLSRIDVEEGAQVTRGQQIGLSGQSGVARGAPHLHFAIHRYAPGTDPDWRSREAVSIDPRPYLCDPLRARLDERRARRPVRFTPRCRMG